jgi:low affinity Fe/Cu permease
MNTPGIIAAPFEKFSAFVIKITGSTFAFGLAFLIVLCWVVCGPVFKFSDTWLLAINTGTSVITFLMVFVIQQSQNKDTLALQLKLNELLAATDAASNELINSEDLTQEELEFLKKIYAKMGEAEKKKNKHKHPLPRQKRT